MGSWKSLAPLPRLSNLFWLVKEPFLDGKQLTFPLSQPSSNRRPSPSSTQIPAASDPQTPSAFGIQASGSQSSHQGPGWPHAAGQEVRASRVELGISTMHLNNHRLSQQPSQPSIQICFLSLFLDSKWHFEHFDLHLMFFLVERPTILDEDYSRLF